MEELLRACEKRSYKSFKDLAIGEYTVKNFSAVDTKFGMRLRVDFEGFYVFLPERLSKPEIIAPTSIEKMNKRQQIMIFRGKDAALQGRYVLSSFFIFSFKNLIFTTKVHSVIYFVYF